MKLCAALKAHAETGPDVYWMFPPVWVFLHELVGTVETVWVQVVQTLICPFWQGSEQTDWMTSLLLLQISWSFIRRPP